MLAADLYVRTHPQGLVIGTLERGQDFHVLATKTVRTKRDGKLVTWAWGYAGGNVDKPGWVPFGSARRNAQGHIVNDSGRANLRYEGAAEAPASVSRTPQYLQRGITYVRGVDAAAGRRTETRADDVKYTRRATVKDPATAKMYRNYTPGEGPSDEVAANFARSPVVRIRYTVDPEWVLVFRKSQHDPDTHAKWVFMRASDLNVDPDPAYERWLAQQREQRAASS